MCIVTSYASWLARAVAIAGAAMEYRIILYCSRCRCQVVLEAPGLWLPWARQPLRMWHQRDSIVASPSAAWPAPWACARGGAAHMLLISAC
jgi:hypothetical protein